MVLDITFFSIYNCYAPNKKGENMKKGISYEIITLDNNLKRFALNKGKCAIPKNPPSPIQMKILHYLIINQEKDIYQRDLEKLLNLRRSTISGILKTMEKHDIITRNDSKIDARSKKIELSSSSKQFYKQSKKVFKEVNDILIKNISEDELETFINVIHKMKSNIKEREDENDKIIKKTK